MKEQSAIQIITEKKRSRDPLKTTTVREVQAAAARTFLLHRVLYKATIGTLPCVTFSHATVMDERIISRIRDAHAFPVSLEHSGDYRPAPNFPERKQMDSCGVGTNFVNLMILISRLVERMFSGYVLDL